MARQLLTNTRRAWVTSREHSGAMRGRRLALPAGVTARYQARLHGHTRTMTQETERAVRELFSHPDVEEHFAKVAAMHAMDISPASQARIVTNQLRQKFQQMFSAVAPETAQQVADQANGASQTAVRSSLKELSGGLMLKTDFLTGTMHEFFKAAVARNVALIRSIPQEYFSDIQDAVLRSITDGRGLADLGPDIERIGGVAERRARDIALDQSHKIYQGLNAGRMQAVGVRSFEWVHSGGGQHPRPLHLDANGKIFSFANLPPIGDSGERVHPGQAIYCRCTMIPVVRFGRGERVG
jgi:SPP1 gp7 family putative phage head morphogenesis protein